MKNLKEVKKAEVKKLSRNEMKKIMAGDAPAECNCTMAACGSRNNYKVTCGEKSICC